MSDAINPRPKNAGRYIFFTVILIGAIAALTTGSVAFFSFSVIGLTALLCVGYELVRQHLNWATLKIDQSYGIVDIVLRW